MRLFATCSNLLLLLLRTTKDVRHGDRRLRRSCRLQPCTHNNKSIDSHAVSEFKLHAAGERLQQRRRWQCRHRLSQTGVRGYRAWSWLIRVTHQRANSTELRTTGRRAGRQTPSSTPCRYAAATATVSDLYTRVNALGDLHVHLDVCASGVSYDVR